MTVTWKTFQNYFEIHFILATPPSIPSCPHYHAVFLRIFSAANQYSVRLSLVHLCFSSTSRSSVAISNSTVKSLIFFPGERCRCRDVHQKCPASRQNKNILLITTHFRASPCLLNPQSLLRVPCQYFWCTHLANFGWTDFGITLPLAG